MAATIRSRVGKRSGCGFPPPFTPGAPRTRKRPTFTGIPCTSLVHTSVPKDGPLQARRAWVARVAKVDLPAMVAGKRAPVEIARNRFSLHRAINDRLREAGP